MAAERPSGPAGPDRGPVRHHDPGAPLACFTARVLVVCPRCGGRALVAPRPGVPAPRYCTDLLFQPRRLVCGGCGATAEWEARADGSSRVGAVPGGTEDPFFRMPLWLQTRCVGRILWAYDEEHVEALSAFVGARLRERGGRRSTRAMCDRLPVWMKSAQNRAEILAGLERLRALAQRSSPAGRSPASHERNDRPRPYRILY
ncbi:hypothetical protein [Streptomyces sp. IBSBF 2806]|uniref:hypothetical protein n=1 Tax=Streptomyces sp. IBSBF 2806 TaxID=2903529 RepID=UPI002FDBFF2B